MKGEQWRHLTISQCEFLKSIRYGNDFWHAVSFVFSMLFLVIIASTVFDVMMRYKPEEPKKIFTSFSLYTNVRDLLKFEPKTSRSIDCFQGLRALSAFWVIAGHRVFRHDRMVSRPMKIESLTSQMTIAVFMTNDYAVDIFFLISGVLIAMSCLRSLDAWVSLSCVC